MTMNTRPESIKYIFCSRPIPARIYISAWGSNLKFPLCHSWIGVNENDSRRRKRVTAHNDFDGCRVWINAMV